MPEQPFDEAERILERVLARPARRYRRAVAAALSSQPAETPVPHPPLDASRQADLARILDEVFLAPYHRRLQMTADAGKFMPEDIVDFLTDLAEEAGIDLRRMGTALSPASEQPEVDVGAALRTVLESAGMYVEVPYALTYSEISRKVLLLLGSALIGIATSHAGNVDSRLGGAIGGVGGLILNIMAARYDRVPLEPDTDWLEELVLRVIEEHGIQSFEGLQSHTNINPELLKKVLAGLRRKGLVEEHRSWLDKTDLRYDLHKHTH